MALPALTLANINQRGTPGYEHLPRHLTDERLAALSSPAGRNITYESHAGNIRMGWHLDQEGRIDGLFIRVHNENTLQAWKILNDQNFDQPCELTVTQLHTTPSIKILYMVRDFRELYGRCASEAQDQEVAFALAADALQNPEQIRTFFGKNRDMLPDSIRDAISPLPRPPQNAQPRSMTHTIIGASLLLCLMTFVARKAMNGTPKLKPLPPKPVPTA